MGLLLVGQLVGLVRSYLRSRKDRLRREGRPLEAEWTAVEINTRLEVDDRHPYRIIAKREDRLTGETTVFKSENLWLDSKPEITRKRVVVYVDCGNADKYWVDVSFITNPKWIGRQRARRSK